jgi:hypothetical protein
MHGVEFEPDDDEPAPVSQEPVIDFEADPIDIREENEDSPPFTFDEPDRRIENADLDNALDEFVDLVNARDLDGLIELLAPDVEADFLREFSRDGVIAGFNDLFLRYPSLLVTRGDLGSQPIVAVWIFDREADRFDPLGYMTLELGESAQDLIRRVDYTEELPDSEDLVVEAPERSELSEWEDWSELDED